MTTQEHVTGQFEGKGGLSLHCQSWRVPRPVGVLVFVHGMGEHSDRYQFPAAFFSKRQFNIHAYDQRGHGQSEGRRAYAESFEDFLEDLHLFLAKVRRQEAHRKIFLVGHSFGGQVVLNYVSSKIKRDLAGVIVSSPNLKIRMAVPFYKLFAARALSALVPTLQLGNEIDPRWISHDPLVIRDYQTDPFVLRKLTVRLADVMMANQERLQKLAHLLTLPCLLMHAGGDLICDPEGTRKFFEKVPARDKQLKIYKGFYHELFNEVERDKVFKDMEAWLEKHL